MSVVAAAGLTVAVWSSAFIAIRHERYAFGPGEIALRRLLVDSLPLAKSSVLAGRPE